MEEAHRRGTVNQCRCRVCGAWFSDGLLIVRDGSRLCPACGESDIEEVEKN